MEPAGPGEKTWQFTITDPTKKHLRNLRWARHVLKELGGRSRLIKKEDKYEITIVAKEKDYEKIKIATIALFQQMNKFSEVLK